MSEEIPHFLDAAYSSLENEVLSPKVRNFFHPKDQGPKENNCFPGLEKDNFRGHTLESVSDLNHIFWIYKLNTSLVQIPAIAEENILLNQSSKKIIFEVTL